MENGLTFMFKATDLRALLADAQSTHVYIVASLKTGKIGTTPVAIMTVLADTYKEVITSEGGRMERVSTQSTVGCPVPPCKDPEEEGFPLECEEESNALLNSYKTNAFLNGFNF